MRLEMEELPAVLTIDDAIAKQQFIGPTRRIQRGDVDGSLGGRRASSGRHVDERRPGAFLPRAASRPGGSGRSGADHDSLVHAEPDRDPGRRGPLPGVAAEPGRLRLPADGRRLRRQGNAGGACGPSGGAGRSQDAPAGTPRPHQRPGHAGHRQAASVPGALPCRLHRGRASSRACRWISSPTAASRPTCPWRSWSGPLLHADNAYYIPHVAILGNRMPDQPAVQHGVSRLRRTAGRRRDREHHRRDRRSPRPRRLRGSAAQLLRRRRPQRHALWPGGPVTTRCRSCSSGWR